MIANRSSFKESLLKKHGIKSGTEQKFEHSSGPDATRLCALVNEKFLFHATHKEHVKPISSRGFDWRLAGTKNGAVLGKGNYFARDASYSARYCFPSRSMFLVRVLVGDSVKGAPQFLRPPPLKKNDPYGETYDSCVDDPRIPSIYVTFEFGQSYPAYLIHF